MEPWPAEETMANGTVNRFFGGSPLSVLVRLILLSIVVGVILSALGFDPFDIWRSFERLVRSIWNMGWDAIDWAWRYFLLGAVIVVPIWLVVRLAKGGRP
jgi:apolipoprotein N-acyltransferase